MDFIERRILYPSGEDKVYTVYPIGDTHIGDIASDESLLKKVVTEIAESDGAYALGMGDYINAIIRADKRFSIEELAEWVTKDMLLDLPKYQVERFLSIVEPIRGKWLAMLNGNHEGVLDHYGERSTYTDIVRGCKTNLADKLALGEGGFVVLKFRQESVSKKSTSDGWKLTIFCHHGEGSGGGGAKLGSKALALDDIKGQFDAHVYLMGHTHVRMAMPIGDRIGVSNYGFVHNTLWGAWTGTTLETYEAGKTTYASQKRMPPRGVGFVRLRIIPQKRKFWIEYY